MSWCVTGMLFIAAGFLCALKTDLFEGNRVQRTVLRQQYRERGQTLASQNV